MHTCKLEEHIEHTCPEAIVPCPCATYGCNETMKRKRIGTHIQRCPASIVKCKFSHQRIKTPSLGLVNIAQPAASCSFSDEILVDQALLDGDLEVWKTDKLELLTLDGKVKLLAPNSSEEFDTDEIPSLSYDTEVGVMTKQYWTMKKRYAAEVANLSKRACIDCDVSHENDPFFNRSKKKTKPVIKACTFMCNEIVRREEFPDHWKSIHLDIQLGDLVRRCPMRLYGCQFGVSHLTPQPEGSQLEYDKNNDCFLYKMPSFVQQQPSQEPNNSLYAAEIEKKQELALYGYGSFDEESFDVLGQLPTEVLMIMFRFLDSQSLWSLSQVNHYMRKVCQNLVESSGMVYWTWERDSSGSWKPGSKVYCYSV